MHVWSWLWMWIGGSLLTLLAHAGEHLEGWVQTQQKVQMALPSSMAATVGVGEGGSGVIVSCLLYTSPSPRDAHESRMPSSA